MVNGIKGKSFNLQRCVRQGCPLAPYLILLVANVIAHMLLDPKYGIQGLRMPNGSTILSQLFTDDTLLFLIGSTDDLNKVLTVFQLHSQAFGAKVNWHKSRVIKASDKVRTWQWGQIVGLVWLEKGKYACYLGHPLGFEVRKDELDNTVINKIRDNIQRWPKKQLSLVERLLIINQVILASISYVVSCYAFSASAMKKIGAIV